MTYVHCNNQTQSSPIKPNPFAVSAFVFVGVKKMFLALHSQRLFCHSRRLLPLEQQQKQQLLLQRFQPSRRSYIFLPASWKAVQSSIQTWLGNKAKERTVWVKLLRDNYRYQSNAALAATLSFRYRPAWWIRYQRQLPSTAVILRASKYQYRASRHWWRHRRGLWMNQVRKRFRRTPQIEIEIETETETETPFQIKEFQEWMTSICTLRGPWVNKSP